MTNHYELLYIIPGNFSEEKVQPMIDKVTHLIKEVGGEITKDDNWGKKRLAYPIKNIQQGYYILNQIDLKAPHVRELDKKLKVMPEILRYQIIKIEKRKVVAKKPRIKPSKPKEEIRPSPEIKPGIKVEKKIEEKKEVKTKKVSLEELDKKIDEILQV